MPTTWKKLLPSWPQAPLSLWLTLGLAALSGLNLYADSEVWAHHPQARFWWLAVLAGALPLAGLQAGVVLWRWCTAYAGPWWAAALLRLAVLGSLGVLAVGILLAVGAAGLVIYSRL